MSLLPQERLDAVVFIRTDQGGLGTGFLIGVDIGDAPDAQGKRHYVPFAVTNKHVISGAKTSTITLNTAAGCKAETVENKDWIESPDGADLVVMPLNSDYLLKVEAVGALIFEDHTIASEESFIESIITGQEVFLLGFPLGLSGIEKTHPVARMGIVARNDKELLGKEGNFWLDINNFPGNSGGPIFIKPSILHLNGRQALMKADLIGLISAYIPYSKKLFDNTTNPPQPKMVIEENSGIAIAIPIYKAFILARAKIAADKRKRQKLVQVEEAVGNIEATSSSETKKPLECAQESVYG